MHKQLAASLFLMISLFLISGCTNEPIQPVSDRNEHKTDAEKNATLALEASILKAHFIDVGQADATLLQFQDDDEEVNVLIDTGDWTRTDTVAYLHSKNIEAIDIIAISHPHADHIGQLDKIITEFDVTEVWMNGETVTSDVFVKSLDAIETHGVDYYEPKVGEIFDIGSLQIEVLHPQALTGSLNNNSLVLRATYGDVTFLFTGDAEQQAERDMLSGGVNLKSTILHMGHHGSKTSSTPDFLEAVNPEIGIYSAGTGNSYGHPDPEVLGLAKKRNLPVYGTDTHGTIIVETDGESYHVLTNEQGTLPNETTKNACVDINKATADELQRIIHIGKALAPQLIQLRPFHSLDELVKINGIGPARLDDIKAEGLACLGG